MTDESSNLDSTRDSSSKNIDGDKTVSSQGAAPSSQSLRGLPSEIGGYKIISVLGEGGMGIVYEAEQPSPRRMVALKVVRGVELVDDMRLKMFEREAATLARLDHPNIGRIYESGRTQDGRHFFAMELVRGPILSEWLSKRPQTLDRAELETRLRLFRQICDAVHYAHQRGVIHRDLKPSNLIVTDTPASGSDITTAAMIKILDFGLARITEEDVAATQVTEIGVIKGTLPYMSPEQARGEVDSIDVRTDVYALGVILYELLTRQRPYKVDSGSLLSAVRIICEETPRPLAENWHATMRLDPDLATITATALEKDADRRYSSAQAFGDDVGRFLSSQPIQARPPSTVYLVKKLIARRKALFATLAAAMVLLVVAAIALSVLYVRSEANLVRALDAEQSARREAETARRTSDFLVGLFQSSNPEMTRGETVTAREVIDEGAARLDKELANEPLMQARLMFTIAQVYRSLGLFDKAATLADKSLSIRRANLPAGSLDIAGSEHLRAQILEDQGKSEEAVKGFAGALALYEAAGTAGTDGLIDVLGNLSWLLGQIGELQAADSAIVRALNLATAKQPPDESRILNLLNNQASIEINLGRPDSALAILKVALPLNIKMHGDSSYLTGRVLTNISVAQSLIGNFAEAGENAVKALAIYRGIYGEDHPEVVKALANVGIYLAQQGKQSEALPYFESAVVALTKIHGVNHPDVASGYVNLGFCQFESGDPKSAVADLSKAVAIYESLGETGSSSFSLALYDLALARAALGELVEAKYLLTRVIAIDEKNYGPESGDVAEDLKAMVDVLRKMGQEAEAKVLEARVDAINAKLAPPSTAEAPADSGLVGQ